MARWDPKRWREIDALFQAAVARPPEDREAFLDETCGGDPELRAAVGELLAADDGGTELLDEPVRAAAASVVEDPAGSLAGQRIGPYRLFRELGRGGMGAVYLAGRADEEFHQQVTVKVIKPGMDSEGIARRFRNERQILASLDHPNVARLLDGGSTDGGQPYFVMEYVEGEPIDRYCDHRKLPIEERLELFCKVCSAVQSAHQNLVVHRDLKPGNVLVTAAGEPKLLDFGVAKLLNPEMAGQTVAATGIDQWRLMTPEYASPEQVRGGPITTASDVYSLGVLLYELLTGHRPYRFANHLPQEIERVVCDTDPEKPSTAVAREEDTGTGETLVPEALSALRGGRPEGLRRKLSGDLDNIVLMAMRKEPQRRYVSAAQLADDLRHHLEGRPVIARPATFGYRAGKFVRRHTLGVTFVLLLAIFAAAMTVQSIRIARERDRAELAQARAESVSDFLVNLFKVSDRGQTGGREVTARELLDKGSQEISQGLTEEPELQAHLMETMGRAYSGLSLYEPARELLERALALRRGSPAPDEEAIAENLMALAGVLFATNKSPRAEDLAREALTIRRSLWGAEHPLVASSENLLAEILIGLGKNDDAEKLHREILSRRRSLLGNESIDVAESLNNIAWLIYQRGDYRGALELFDEAFEIRRKLQGEEHPEVLLLMNNRANVLRVLGDEAAESLCRETLARYRRVLGDDHVDVAMPLATLAAVLQDRGRYDEAEPLFREALGIYRNRLGDEHPYTAVARNNLAALLVDREELEEAESQVREALGVYERSGFANRWRYAQARNTLGECLTGLGRYPEAERLLADSYAVLRDKTGDRSFYTRKALLRLVDLYEAWGKPDQVAEHRTLLSELDEL